MRPKGTPCLQPEDSFPFMYIYLRVYKIRYPLFRTIPCVRSSSLVDLVLITTPNHTTDINEEHIRFWREAIGYAPFSSEFDELS